MEGSSGHIVTKAVLLDWLSSALGTHYYSLEQLQSGAAYVRAFAHVFSSHVDLVEVQWVEHPRTADDIDKNMEVLESTLSSLGIPPVLDPDGIRNAQYPAHYDLLVLLYFVYKMTLAESPGSFDATLARPVTPELADFLRSYELPQVVSKTGAWLCVRGDTTVTTQKAPQQELPAIGSVMQAHGMQHTTELNGQAGKFLGASDGHPQRFLVQFPQPHGCVLVFPENVRVMSGPRRAPVVDSLVRILATGSTLDFCTGHVTGYKDTTDGLMCFVDTDAQGVVLLEVDCLEEIVTIHDDDAVDFPAVAVGAGGGGGGTGGTGGGGGGGGRADVAELEKLQMENSLLRAALTAANCARDGQSQGLSSHATRMKAIHEREMATVKNTYETKIETLKAGFARDLTAQTEHIQTQYAEVWADLQHMNTAFREKTWPWLNSSMYSHAPNDELIAQSAALEKLFPNKMIEMLEETNASLSECVCTLPTHPPYPHTLFLLRHNAKRHAPTRLNVACTTPPLNALPCCALCSSPMRRQTHSQHPTHRRSNTRHCSPCCRDVASPHSRTQTCTSPSRTTCRVGQTGRRRSTTSWPWQCASRI